MSNDIFLSYRRTDQALARSLVTALEAQGLEVWWDQEIEGGDDWREAIVEGLSSSKALVILFSDNCNSSKQLKKELAIADTLDKEVIPVLIEDTKPKGHYLYELAARNWLQIHPNPEGKVNDLAQRLATELGTPRRDITAPSPSVVGQGPGQESMLGTSPGIGPLATPPPPEPDLPPETLDKMVEATQEVEANIKDRRDFLPFKWYEILIALAVAGLTALGGFDPDTGEIISGSIPLDTLGMFLMTLLAIAMLVFPFRYFFRKRRVWRAARYYALSVLILAISLGVVFGIHPDVVDDTMGAGENIITALIGSILVFGLIGLVTFGIYGLLHFQRTMRSFNSNVETL
ncbi:MAG: TIR domain-containing protein [Pseudomonadota bacterium]